MKTMLYTLIYLATTTIAALLALCCAVLAYQNAGPIQLHFFGATSIEMPLGFVLVAAIALGLVLVPLLRSVLLPLTGMKRMTRSRPL